MSPKCFSLSPRSECVTVALHRAFWISTEVVTAPFGCYMAGVTWKRLPSRCKFCVHHTTMHQFAVSFTLKPHTQDLMHVCLAVTCRLHLWQNDRDLLGATAVTRGWNGSRNKSQHRKLTLENNILPPLLPGTQTRDLSIKEDYRYSSLSGHKTTLIRKQQLNVPNRWKMIRILPNTGQENNIAQPKTDKWFSFSLNFFHRFWPFSVVL